MVFSVTDRIPFRVWARVLHVIGQGMEWRDRLVTWWQGPSATATATALLSTSPSPTPSVRRLYAFTKNSLVLLQEFDDVTSAHLTDLSPYLTVSLDSLPPTISFHEGADLLTDHQGYIVEYVWSNPHSNGDDNDDTPPLLLEETAYHYLLLPAGTRGFLTDGSSLRPPSMTTLPEFSEISLNQGEVLLPEVFPQMIDAWAGLDGQFGRFQPGWSQELLALAFHQIHGQHLFSPQSPYHFAIRDPLSEEAIQMTYTPQS